MSNLQCEEVFCHCYWQCSRVKCQGQVGTALLPSFLHGRQYGRLTIHPCWWDEDQPWHWLTAEGPQYYSWWLPSSEGSSPHVSMGPPLHLCDTVHITYCTTHHLSVPAHQLHPSRGLPKHVSCMSPIFLIIIKHQYLSFIDKANITFKWYNTKHLTITVMP